MKKNKREDDWCEYSGLPSVNSYASKLPIDLLKTEEIDRIIEMAWEDKTPFEAIKKQFNLSESNVIELMRLELKESSFKLWRKRVNSGTSKKHFKKRNLKISKFKSTMQKIISNNKISKRRA